MFTSWLGNVGNHWCCWLNLDHFVTGRIWKGTHTDVPKFQDWYMDGTIIFNETKGKSIRARFKNLFV